MPKYIKYHSTEIFKLHKMSAMKYLDTFKFHMTGPLHALSCFSGRSTNIHIFSIKPLITFFFRDGLFLFLFSSSRFDFLFQWIRSQHQVM